MSQSSKEANRAKILSDPNYDTYSPNFLVASERVMYKPAGSYIIKKHHVPEVIKIQQAEFEIQVIDEEGKPQAVPLEPVEGGFKIPGTTKIYPTLVSLIFALIHFKREVLPTQIPVESKAIEAHRQEILHDKRFKLWTFKKTQDYLYGYLSEPTAIIRPINSFLNEFEIQFSDGGRSARFKPVEGGFMLSDSDSSLTPAFFNVHKSLELLITRLKNYDQYLVECCKREIIDEDNFHAWSFQEAEKYILDSDEGSYIIVPDHHLPNGYKIYFNTGSDIKVIMLEPSPTGTGFQPIPANLYWDLSHFKTLPEFFKQFGIGEIEDAKKPKELTTLEKEQKHDQEILNHKNFKGLKALLSISNTLAKGYLLSERQMSYIPLGFSSWSTPEDVNPAVKAYEERLPKAQLELLSTSQTPFLIVPDTNYSGAYNIIRYNKNKTIVLSTQICATERGFAICSPGKDQLSYTRLQPKKAFKTLDDLLRTLDLLTPEKRMEDEKKILEVLRQSKDPLFKDIKAPEATEELEKATQETAILIPAPNGFILLCKIPPLPIISKLIDISKENTLPESPWFQDPVVALHNLTEEVFSAQRKLRDQLNRIERQKYFRKMDLKSAEEELMNDTFVDSENKDGYRIIPGTTPNTFILVYRLMTLQPISQTIGIIGLKEVKNLIEQMRSSESMKKKLLELQERVDYQPTLTGRDAEADLDMTFTEKSIIIPNPDGSFECFVRVPPLTTHRKYDPNSTDLEITFFMERIANDLRNDIKGRREAIRAVQESLDLKQVSDMRESSMRALTGFQVGLLEVVREKYGKKMTELGGEERVIKNFKDFLERKYNEHFAGLLKFLETRFKESDAYKKELDSLRRKGAEPQKIRELEDKIRSIELQRKNLEDAKQRFPQIFKDKKLPLHCDASSNHPFIQQAYLVNPYHTAWRYFLKPNPLINPDALYATNEYNSRTGRTEATHSKIYPESRRDLALLWLAASDRTIKPSEGFTVEGMMEAFSEAIVGIARGHNWDAIDAMREGPAKQKFRTDMLVQWGHYVDDLRLDTPSCPMGVNQRLMDSIIGNPIADRPDTRRLDPQVIRDSFQSLLGTQFEKYLNSELQKQEKAGVDRKANLETQIQFMTMIREWFEKRYVMYENLPPDQQKFFDKFRLDPKDIKATIKELKPRFGEHRFEWVEMRTDVEHYSSAAHYFESLCKSPDPWTLPAAAHLDEILKEKSEHLEKELKDIKEAEKMRALISAHREETKLRREKKGFVTFHGLNFDLDIDKDLGKGAKPKSPKGPKTPKGGKT